MKYIGLFLLSVVLFLAFEGITNVIYQEHFHTDVWIQAAMYVWFGVLYLAILIPICAAIIVSEIRKRK